MEALGGEMAFALAEWAAAKEALQPFDAAFKAAQKACAAVVGRWGMPPYGDGEARTRFRATYAERLRTGCEAHPHRRRMKEAERLVRVLREALKELSAEIEAHGG